MTAATLMANAPARVNVTPLISSRTSSGRKMAVATAAKYSPQRLSSHNPTPSMASRAALLGAYAALEAIEGVGLWLLKRWGEYFAAVATAIFLPLEVRELISGGRHRGEDATGHPARRPGSRWRLDHGRRAGASAASGLHSGQRAGRAGQQRQRARRYPKQPADEEHRNCTELAGHRSDEEIADRQRGDGAQPVPGRHP